MDPIMAKSVLQILGDNLKKFEKNFGEIKIMTKKSKKQEMNYSEEAARYIG